MVMFEVGFIDGVLKSVTQVCGLVVDKLLKQFICDNYFS